MSRSLAVLFCGVFLCIQSGRVQAASAGDCQKLAGQKQWLASAKCFFQFCRTFYQQKQYLVAARCFRKYGQQTQKRPHFSLKSFYQGRFGWGAVLAMDRAAASASTQDAMLHREQALGWLLELRRKKLFANDNQKLAGLRLERTLRQSIGYATLQIETGHKEASTCLQGFRFKRCIDGPRWTMQLRPGNYRLLLRYPGAPPLIRNSRMVLAHGERKSLVFVPPTESQKASLSLASQPAGAHIFVDAVYVGKTPLKLNVYVGVHQIEIKKTCHEIVSRAVAIQAAQPNKFAATLRQEGALRAWNEKRQSRRGGLIVGWSLAGAGTLLALLGGIFHITASVQHGAVVGNLDPITYQEQVNQGNVFRTLGYIGIGTGVAVGVFGGIWLLTQRLPPRKSLPCQVKIQAQ